MPKPLFGDNGSGCTRTRVVEGRRAAVAGDGYAGFSQMGLHYIAGLLKHARALARSSRRRRTLQAAGTWVRSAGEPGVLAANGRRVPDPDVLGESEGEARRIPAADTAANRTWLRSDADAGWTGIEQTEPGERWTRTSTTCRRKR